MKYCNARRPQDSENDETQYTVRLNRLNGHGLLCVQMKRCLIGRYTQGQIRGTPVREKIDLKSRSKCLSFETRVVSWC